MAQDDLKQMIASAVEAVGYEFWGMEYVPGSYSSLLRVFIDNPESSIDVDDCETASRQVSSVLEVHDPIKGDYTLEVSSPGVERPLFTIEQFARYVGYNAKFVLHQAVLNKRRFRGVISAVEGEQLTIIAEDDDELKLTLADITKANLVFDFKGGKKHGK